MSTPSILEGIDVNRALKDEEYRNTLSAEQRQALLQVAGASKLSDDELEEVAGGLSDTIKCTTNGCSTLRCKAPIEGAEFS